MWLWICLVFSLAFSKWCENLPNYLSLFIIDYMKTVLKLFNQTFNKVPLVEVNNDFLKKRLRQINNIQQQDYIARLFYASQLILSQTAQLQNQQVLNVLDHFTTYYASIDYSYHNHQFTLKRKTKSGTEILYHIPSLFLEKEDNPARRQTLYLHELKDMDKHLTIEKKPGLPKFWKDHNRKQIQKQTLDKKNPFGLPFWTPPLQLRLKVMKDEKICHFKVVSYLGKIHIINVGSQENYKLDTMIIQSQTQKLLFRFLEDVGGLYEQEYGMLSKLAFVGGNVKKIEWFNGLYGFGISHFEK